MPAAKPQDLRRVFGLFTTGVTVVTGVSESIEPVGVTANSVTSVSLDPPLLLWCLANKSGSLSAFKLGAAFAVHVLAAHQKDIALHFARAGGAKFEVDAWWRAHPEPPIIAEALARIGCRVESLYAGGDHTIIVGRVEALDSRNDAPLAFQGSRFGRFEPSAGDGEMNVWSNLSDHWM